MDGLNCFRFCLLCSKLESVGHCLWESSTIIKFTSPEIWKQLALLLNIHHGSSNMKISVSGHQLEGIYCWKAYTLSTSWCLGCSLVMVMLCLLSSSHLASNSICRPSSNVWRRLCLLGLRGWQLEDLQPNICHLIPQIAIPMIIMYEAWLSERPPKLHATSKMTRRQG